jgi:hypothetical protein
MMLSSVGAASPEAFRAVTVTMMLVPLGRPPIDGQLVGQK